MDHGDTIGLDLAPFRGLRYDPVHVDSLGAVTTPPYDVVEPDRVPALCDAEPHNIVRLVLPPTSGPTAEHRYAHAGALLRRWLHQRVLRPDPHPALYVYEQRTGDRVRQRGVIGALALSDAAVLPHEDVMPDVVADRTELMRALAANPEPILLSYTGDGAASDTVEHATGRPRLLSTCTPDGVRHTLWALTDPDEHATVRADLVHHTALIADGHHRWAAYQHLRAAHPHAPAWQRGLVLLVDNARHPLHVDAIHRVLPRLAPTHALAALTGHTDSGGRQTSPRGTGERPVFRTGAPHNDVHDALDELARTPGPAFVLSGDGTHRLVHDPDPALWEAAVRRDRPTAWRELDTTVLHALLLDRVWQVPDNADHVSYVHNLDGALREARRSGGSAVLMRPTTEAMVRSLAEQGLRMPHKSTSFGPKPATGLVLRSLELD